MGYNSNVNHIFYSYNLKINYIVILVSSKHSIALMVQPIYRLISSLKLCHLSPLPLIAL